MRFWLQNRLKPMAYGQRPCLTSRRGLVADNWMTGVAGMILIPLGFKFGKQIARPADTGTAYSVSTSSTDSPVDLVAASNNEVVVVNAISVTNAGGSAPIAFLVKLGDTVLAAADAVPASSLPVALSEGHAKDLEELEAWKLYYIDYYQNNPPRQEETGETKYDN